ncbi:hypothetical protein HUS23_13905 [Ectothiorhodospiraceae bacterium 2226]|nr:hypothetical protein HUS23_13905 [Ectothiorhodospiraceae bacterium 2226]
MNKSILSVALGLIFSFAAIQAVHADVIEADQEAQMLMADAPAGLPDQEAESGDKEKEAEEKDGEAGTDMLP